MNIFSGNLVTMIPRKGKIMIFCEHACIHAFANCKECYVSLYKQLYAEKNSRLSKTRDGINPNFHCPSLGLDCACDAKKKNLKNKMKKMKTKKLVKTK